MIMDLVRYLTIEVEPQIHKVVELKILREMSLTQELNKILFAVILLLILLVLAI